MSEVETPHALASRFEPESLLEGIANGERKNESLLVEKYWRSLLFIIKQRTNDFDLAHDIAQETLILVIKKARNREIREPKALSSFIRNTGINLFIAHARKENRRKTDSSDSIDVSIVDHKTNLHNNVNIEKAAELVLQMIGELPNQRDRELLVQYFVDGKDKDGLCAEFSISTAHFDRVLFRARQRLKQLLEHKLSLNTNDFSLSKLIAISLLLIGNVNFFENDMRDKFNQQHLHNCHVAQPEYLLNRTLKAQQSERGVE